MKLACAEKAGVQANGVFGKLPEPLSEGILKRVKTEGNELFLNGLSTAERIRLHFARQGEYTVNIEAARGSAVVAEGVPKGDSPYSEIRLAVDRLVQKGLAAYLMNEGVIDSTIPVHELLGDASIRQRVKRGHDGTVYRVCLGGKTVIEKKPHSSSSDAMDWMELLLFLKEKGFSVPNVFGVHGNRILMEDLGDLAEFHEEIEHAPNRLGLLLHAAREAAMLHKLNFWLWDSTRAWQIRLGGKSSSELFLVDVGGLRNEKGTGWDETLFCLCAFSGSKREFHRVLNEYLKYAPENKEKVEELRKEGFARVKEKYCSILVHLDYG